MNRQVRMRISPIYCEQRSAKRCDNSRWGVILVINDPPWWLLRAVAVLNSGAVALAMGNSIWARNLANRVDLCPWLVLC